MPIPTNDGFGVAAPRFIDLRQGKIVAGKSVPYDSTAEALALVPQTRRAEGLILFVKTAGIINQYQFVGGVEDDDLQLITGNASSLTTTDPSIVTPAGKITTVLRIATASAQSIKIGTSFNGEEIMESREINGSHLHGCLIDGGTSIYFTGTFNTIELKFL